MVMPVLAAHLLAGVFSGSTRRHSDSAHCPGHAGYLRSAPGEIETQSGPLGE